MKIEEYSEVSKIKEGAKPKIKIKKIKGNTTQNSLLINHYIKINEKVA